MYLNMGTWTDLLWLWCHSEKEKKSQKKVGIFLLCQIQVCRAEDHRVKFLDTPFKSNEWWNPCTWTYFPMFWLKTTELVVASSLGMCPAWFSRPAHPGGMEDDFFCEFLTCGSLRDVLNFHLWAAVWPAYIPNHYSQHTILKGNKINAV